MAREKENPRQADCAVEHNASKDTEPAKIAHYRPDGFLQVINLTPIATASSAGPRAVARSVGSLDDTCCPELTSPARIVAWSEAGDCFIWRNYGQENSWSAGSGGRSHHASECPSSADFNATIAGGDELSRLARSDCESGPTIASRQCAAGSTSRTSRDPIGPGFGPARSPSSPPSS